MEIIPVQEEELLLFSCPFFMLRSVERYRRDSGQKQLCTGKVWGLEDKSTRLVKKRKKKEK